MASASSIAVEKHACLQCKQAPGKKCRTKGGRIAAQTHGERIQALTQEEIEMCRINIIDFEDIISNMQNKTKSVIIK